jgi:GxxExxY protein
MAILIYSRQSYLIQGAFYKIYKTFRNNYKEVIYHNALVEELTALGFTVEKNKKIKIFYQNKLMGYYCPDLVIDKQILIEIKSKPLLTKDDIKQFWYYLKGTEYRLGYLVNFGKSNGVEIERKVYDLARKEQKLEEI